MRRVYWLQIVDDTGTVATLTGGGKLEIELLENFRSRLVSQPVGYLTSRTDVAQIAADTLEAMLQDLKRDTRYTELVLAQAAAKRI